MCASPDWIISTPVFPGACTARYFFISDSKFCSVCARTAFKICFACDSSSWFCSITCRRCGRCGKGCLGRLLVDSESALGGCRSCLPASRGLCALLRVEATCVDESEFEAESLETA